MREQKKFQRKIFLDQAKKIALQYRFEAMEQATLEIVHIRFERP